MAYDSLGNCKLLQTEAGKAQQAVDSRDYKRLRRIFRKLRKDVRLVVWHVREDIKESVEKVQAAVKASITQLNDIRELEEHLAELGEIDGIAVGRMRAAQQQVRREIDEHRGNIVGYVAIIVNQSFAAVEIASGKTKPAADGISFDAIKPTYTYIESFQIVTQIDGTVVRKELRNWGEIMQKVNGFFPDAKLGKQGRSRQENRGPYGSAWLILEEESKTIGKLWSYGQAHRDGASSVGRDNMHYFEVKAELKSLRAAAQILKSNPRATSQFVREVFSWDNLPRASRQYSREKVNIFIDLKDLHVHY